MRNANFYFLPKGPLRVTWAPKFGIVLCKRVLQYEKLEFGKNVKIAAWSHSFKKIS
jgi:hypothetical protein